MKSSGRTIVTYLLGLSSAAAAFAKHEGVPAHRRPAAEQVTFNLDIAPILFHSCAICHHPGEAGPFPLLTYADAKARARQIVAVTARRYMPPWLPEPQELKFADELRLSDGQIALIQKWVDQGSVEGAPNDLPSAPQFVPGWQLGQPDRIVEAEKPYTLPASGSDMYWNFIFRTPVDRTRWLKAIEIHPGDKRVVHHANILVDRNEAARRQESERGAGFAGMELKIESEAFDPDSHFLFWKPGTVPRPEPDGMALRLDKDTDLVLNIHLQPSGKPEKIQPSLGLYFTDKPATRFPLLLQLENDRQLDIPPGEKHFVVTDKFTLPVDVDLLAIYPHAHCLGKDLRALATLPDGSVKTLIHIPRWDLNWQAVYRYADPVALPKGTTISMRYVYDNSSDNVANPNDPPRHVVAGNRSSDEMAHLWLQVLPHTSPNANSDPRWLLQEAMAQHNVEKNPDDFESHYNLAAMLMARSAQPEAVQHFKQAVRLRPQDATANNALGASLMAAGRFAEAIPYLSASIKARPDNFDAHYNLANALASQEKFSEAVEHYRTAVRLHPDDANAETNLGSALAEAGHPAEAKLHFQRALQIDPNHKIARENLEQISHEVSTQQVVAPQPKQTISPDAAFAEARRLAQQGKFDEAIGQLEALAAKQPDAKGLAHELGVVYYKKSDYLKAVANFKKALDENPGDSEAIQLLGLSYYLAGRPAEAIVPLEKVQTWYPSANVDASYILGICYMQTKDFPNSRKAFAKMFSVPPDSAASYLFTARMMLRFDFAVPAEDYAKKAAELDPKLPLAHSLLGEIYLYKSRIPEATEQFQKELELNPGDASVYYKLADAYSRAQKYDDAEKLLQRSIWLDATPTGPYILMGKVLEKKGESALAVRALQRALAMDPNNPIPHHLLGLAYRDLGKTEDAERELKLSEQLQNRGEAKP
ncbi:MAG TPA: tetratricopeptide repeat protein [Candidatus Acidoferrum sp.]|nr:tetratricopeptide repeat protein [Candidatus Acidoferrum sp.]